MKKVLLLILASLSLLLAFFATYFYFTVEKEYREMFGPNSNVDIEKFINDPDIQKHIRDQKAEQLTNALIAYSLSGLTFFLALYKRKQKPEKLSDELKSKIASYKDFSSITVKNKATGKTETISIEDWVDIIKIGNEDKFEIIRKE